MQLNTADTAWLLASAALVMFMTPGLALFYGGLVRSKNTLATVMQSFIALAVVTVVWVIAGYTLAFGPDKGSFIGGLSFLGLKGVGGAPTALAPTVPASAFMVFQLMFAVITPALITGAFAERMRFPGYLLFIGLWSLLVYSPVAHWVWGGGFLGLNGIGALDFAGGTVVHINAGAAALAAAIYLGRRSGYGSQAFVPHNVPMVILGAGILWFGWFGFNAGSALASGALASSAFVATHLGAAGAVFGWLIPERIRHGKATTIGAATGAVAGLVAITPASGYVGPLPALAIGFAAGLVCFLAVSLKSRLRLDDSLDVVGVHMVGGIVGALLTGVFASLAINSAGAAGGIAQLGRQALAVVITLGFSFVATMVILKIVDLAVGLRATEDDEDVGLDLSQHGEAAYTLVERAGVPRETTSIAEIGDVPDEVIRRAVDQLKVELARQAVETSASEPQP
ncbi:MAG TPA: ammonium transporter [Actinomycetota bacterium]|nr:ammonium transporter [Actinomycetota bacterium]